jgi:hypothetical protein
MVAPAAFAITIFFAESELTGSAAAAAVFAVLLAAGACAVELDFGGVVVFGCCAPATAAVTAVAIANTSALRVSMFSSNVESSLAPVRGPVLGTVARAGRGRWR